MKRQVLKTILFALPKLLELTARRFPAYRERL
ncbi:molybdopterin oxidoreductase, partial [Burkholderia sp. BT03]